MGEQTAIAIVCLVGFAFLVVLHMCGMTSDDIYNLVVHFP